MQSLVVLWAPMAALGIECDKECFELLWHNGTWKLKGQVCSDSVESFYPIVVCVQLKFVPVFSFCGLSPVLLLCTNMQMLAIVDFFFVGKYLRPGMVAKLKLCHKHCMLNTALCTMEEAKQKRASCVTWLYYVSTTRSHPMYLNESWIHNFGVSSFILGILWMQIVLGSHHVSIDKLPPWFISQLL